MKIGILCSKVAKDVDGLDFQSLLDKEGIPYFEVDNPLFIEEKDIENIDADYLIVLGKHSLVDQPKIFSVHPVGNWNQLWPREEDNLGGKEGTLGRVSASLLNFTFQSLKRNNDLTDYIVSIECTHHGPNISKPILFLEIGSNKDSWKNPRAQEVILKTLKDILGNFEVEEKEAYIVLGGSHYNELIHKLLERGILISHMCPSSQVPYLTEKIILEAIDKTEENVDCVLIDVSGVGQHMEMILKILEKNNIKHKFLHELFEH
jgi:D-aminoacyl-tRNA deacylase